MIGAAFVAAVWALVLVPLALVALVELEREWRDARFDREVRQLFDREEQR